MQLNYKHFFISKPETNEQFVLNLWHKEWIKLWKAKMGATQHMPGVPNKVVGEHIYIAYSI